MSIGAGPLVMFFPIADDVGGDDLVGFLAGAVEREVVGDPEIATEPDDGTAVGRLGFWHRFEYGRMRLVDLGVFGGEVIGEWEIEV